MADQLVAAGAVPLAVSDFNGWMLAEQRRVFVLCQRMLDDSEDASSVTQDVFFKAYRALHEQDFRPGDPTRWLTRIAVNACLDRLRSRRWQFWRRRPNQKDEELILALVPSTAPDAEDCLFAREIGTRLRLAMNRLSARQRAAFTLRHYEDRSIEEISQILDMPVGTVKAHLARSLAKLREELKDLYGLRRTPPQGRVPK